jgi:hypothetical protein
VENADKPAGQRLSLTAVPLSKNITFGAGGAEAEKLPLGASRHQ